MRKKISIELETIILKVIKRTNSHKINLINNLRKVEQIHGTSTKMSVLKVNIQCWQECKRHKFLHSAAVIVVLFKL